MGQDLISTVFMVTVIALVVFLIFREVVTWYWKINKIVDHLRSIDQKLSKITQDVHSNAQHDESPKADLLEKGNKGFYTEDA